ncbi:MAG: guanylate kinase, partial [Schaedlerella arabinosiphila]|nr:guanylate kinase [Schaedlerella arabinosiphila]
PETVLLFVTPPPACELKNRLTGRGTESEAVIDSRLRRAVEEADGMDRYDYLVVNDDLEICTRELHDIIQGEHRRSFRNTEFMERIKQDLQRLKGE